jgi:AGCS family alanine or glycine:cation symporter
MQDFINWLVGILWSSPMIYGALAVGLLFSILTRFLQVRYIKEMFTLMFKGKSSDAGVKTMRTKES